MDCSKSGLAKADQIIIAIILIVLFGTTFAAIFSVEFVHASLIVSGQSTRTTRSITGIELFGSCNSTDYVLPDVEQVSVVNVTTVVNGTTSIHVSTSTSTATVQLINSTSYATTLITNTSTSFVTTNTTNLNPYSPSAEWAVSVCTFAPA